MNPLRQLLPLLVAAVPLAAAIEELRPKSDLTPLPYQQTPHPMPNYLAGQRWGIEGEKITRMQGNSSLLCEIRAMTAIILLLRISSITLSMLVQLV